MTIDDAVSALRTTAAERSRSWLMIHFECTIADHSEIVSGWDKDALGLESVETSEVVSALASCEKVKVCVRFYNYVSPLLLRPGLGRSGPRPRSDRPGSSKVRRGEPGDPTLRHRGRRRQHPMSLGCFGAFESVGAGTLLR